jgi:hypothetical protein
VHKVVSGITPSERWIELVALYAAIPLVLAWAFKRFAYRRAMAPLLWVASAAAVVVLVRDPAFDPAVLYRLPLRNPYAQIVALRFCVFAPPVLALGRWLAPEDFLKLPRRRPGLWLLLAILYPLLSAVPQGILFRVLFVGRYGSLFHDHFALLAVGALAFSLGHVVFRNVPALVITAAGGALFLETYVRTQSMLLAAAEHGAYGVVAFTAGLGRFLYLGAHRVPPGRAPESSLGRSDPGAAQTRR